MNHIHLSNNRKVQHKCLLICILFRMSALVPIYSRLFPAFSAVKIGVSDFMLISV